MGSASDQSPKSSLRRIYVRTTPTVRALRRSMTAAIDPSIAPRAALCVSEGPAGVCGFKAVLTRKTFDGEVRSSGFDCFVFFECSLEGRPENGFLSDALRQ